MKKNEHSRMGSKGIGPEKIREFSFNQMGRLYPQLAPNLWSVFCQLCKIDERTAEAYLEGDTPDVLVASPHAPEDEQGAQHKQKHRSRQKALSVVLMMGLTAFCRSRESNCHGPDSDALVPLAQRHVKSVATSVVWLSRPWRNPAATNTYQSLAQTQPEGRVTWEFVW
jgi:hypothetical protein